MHWQKSYAKKRKHGVSIIIETLHVAANNYGTVTAITANFVYIECSLKRPQIEHLSE